MKFIGQRFYLSFGFFHIFFFLLCALPFFPFASSNAIMKIIRIALQFTTTQPYWPTHSGTCTVELREYWGGSSTLWSVFLGNVFPLLEYGYPFLIPHIERATVSNSHCSNLVQTFWIFFKSLKCVYRQQGYRRTGLTGSSLKVAGLRCKLFKAIWVSALHSAVVWRFPKIISIWLWLQKFLYAIWVSPGWSILYQKMP